MKSRKTAVKSPSTKPKKVSTPESRAKARARRWAKTGVSQATIQWMRDTGNL